MSQRALLPRLEVDHIIPRGRDGHKTSRTCNCRAPAATRSRATARRGTSLPRLRELGVCGVNKLGIPVAFTDSHHEHTRI